MLKIKYLKEEFKINLILVSKTLVLYKKETESHQILFKPKLVLITICICQNVFGLSWKSEGSYT